MSGEELLQIDLECLYESNRRESEAYEKQKKDGNWNRDHPGAAEFPDQETRWANAAAALIGEGERKAEQEPKEEE
jgi:hypothetical protein